MPGEMTEQEAVDLVVEILGGNTVSLSGKVLAAWLAQEFGRVPKSQRPEARRQRRESMTHCDRMLERKRETHFAIAWHIARAERRKSRQEAALRPAPGEAYPWQANLSPEVNAFRQKVWMMQGGAPCR